MWYYLYKLITKSPLKIKQLWYDLYNVMIFRLAGAQIGKRAKIFNKVYLLMCKNSTLEIGNDFTLTSGDCINPLAKDAKACIHLEYEAKLSIGNNVGMSSPTIWVADSIRIGNRVNIGANTIIMDTDCHSLDSEMRFREREMPKYLHNGAKISPVVIEDDVWIGANCIILKGVKIGCKSVVGAGCVVVKDIPNGSIVVGHPMRIISTTSSKCIE